MDEIKVKSWCNVDNLTQNSVWREIRERLEEDYNNPEREVMLDFQGINVYEPWSLTEFQKILKMDNVNFKFASYDLDELNTLVNRIKIKCIMEGCRAERVHKVELQKNKLKTAEELRIETDGNDFIKRFNISKVDGKTVATIEMYKIYDQITTPTTVKSIEYAVEKMGNDDSLEHIDEFIVKIGKMVVQVNITEMLADMIISLGRKGITLFVDSDSGDVSRDLSLHIYIKLSHTYKFVEKLQEFLELKEGTVGFLIKYKKSKATDVFGRQGKGQVISNRIARFGGVFIRFANNSLVKIHKIEIKGNKAYTELKDEYGKAYKKELHNNNTVVKIVSYKGDKFMTHSEWLALHDGNMVDDSGYEINTLPHENVIASINSVGMMDKFLGRDYHFIRAVQRDNSDIKSIIVGFDNDGITLRKVCTVPERAKVVFDDWDIKFNREALEEDIRDTREILKEGNTKEDKVGLGDITVLNNIDMDEDNYYEDMEEYTYSELDEDDIGDMDSMDGIDDTNNISGMGLYN